MSKFNIINNAENLVAYVLTITNKSPKKLRCDIIPTLRLSALAVLEELIRANMANLGDTITKRKVCQNEAKVSIRLIESYASICVQFGYITKHQLSHLSKLTYELYESIINWEESDSKRV